MNSRLSLILSITIATLTGFMAGHFASSKQAKNAASTTQPEQQIAQNTPNHTATHGTNKHSSLVTNDTIMDIDVAAQTKQHDVWVEGDGEIIHILSDDTKGSRHQRFLVELDNGIVVQVAHNIDLAPRVQDLNEGDIIQFKGEYIYNKKGGVLHWTHHNPRGGQGGYLLFEGKKYE